MDAALFVASTLICFAGLELAYRIVGGVPVLRMVDWRTVLVRHTGAMSATDYDPTVGWVARAGIRSAGFNTIEHGVRRNRATDVSVPQRALLVVGDSFTAGSEVDDDQSWPAHLEAQIGERVVNAAVGGWGIDQMV